MFSIVIPTYNRANIIGRALESVLGQEVSDLEIIVVDDFSQDNTEEVILKRYPQVRYYKLRSNMGPGMARNKGIREATRKWVVLLDDDDQLLTGALQQVASAINSFSKAERYPVLQFAHGNAHVPTNFMIATIDAYINNVIEGDFVSVIQKEMFLKNDFAYPNASIGAEHLLWWKIADEYGIPTWNYKIAKLNTDASDRLTDVKQQIKKAKEHAQAQDLTLSLFGEILKHYAPQLYLKKQLGAAIYWLLAGERTLARKRLNDGIKKHNRIIFLLVWLLSYMPRKIIQFCFVYYRRLTL